MDHWLLRWLDTPRRRLMPRIAVTSGTLKLPKGAGASLGSSYADALARMAARVSSGDLFLEARIEGDVVEVAGIDWRGDYEKRFDEIEALVTAAAALGAKGKIVCLSGLGRIIRDRKPTAWGADRWVSWSAKSGGCVIDEGETSSEKKVLAALDATIPRFDGWLASHPAARERLEHREEYGYLDREGRIALSPTYSQVDEMVGDLASVALGDGRRAVIDRSGRIVKEGIVGAGYFLHDLFPFAEPGEMGHARWGYADGSGAVKIAPRFYEAKAFHGPLAIVREGNWLKNVQRWLAPSGELVGDPFDYTSGFADGRAWVFVNASAVFRCVGVDGAPVFDATFANTAAYASGLAAACRVGEQTWGYLDREGAFVVPPAYTQAHPFVEDRAAVKDGATMHLIDRAGRTRGEAFEAAMAPMSEGLIAVRAGGKVGFLDRDGAWAIRPSFDEAYAFLEGMAYASTTIDGVVRWGFVDPRGEWAIAPTFEWANRFEDGLAPAKHDGLYGFIDRTGRWVIAPRWKTMQARFTSGLVWAQLP